MQWNEMMEGMGGMMWAMGLVWLLVFLVLYVNGLINNAAAPPPKPEPGVLDRVKDLF